MYIWFDETVQIIFSSVTGVIVKPEFKFSKFTFDCELLLEVRGGFVVYLLDELKWLELVLCWLVDENYEFIAANYEALRLRLNDAFNRAFEVLVVLETFVLGLHNVDRRVFQGGLIGPLLGAVFNFLV